MRRIEWGEAHPTLVSFFPFLRNFLNCDPHLIGACHQLQPIIKCGRLRNVGDRLLFESIFFRLKRAIGDYSGDRFLGKLNFQRQLLKIFFFGRSVFTSTSVLITELSFWGKIPNFIKLRNFLIFQR